MPTAEPARLVIATGNEGKLREYRELLADMGLALEALDTGVEETGSSYLANAALKAEAARDATGLPSLGDDAGIEVEALDGFPGIYSARLGRDQKERTARLLERLAGRPRPWRARFVAVLALARPGDPTVAFRGEREGEVIPEWRGAAGFGYDPIFWVPAAGKTFGEMSSSEKHAWSHRGAAAKQLRQFILAPMATGGSAQE